MPRATSRAREPGGDHLNGRAVVVAQAHDGAPCRTGLSICDRANFESFIAIVGRGLCGGCFTGCHGDPFVCGLSGLRVSWPGMPPLSEAT